MTYITSPMIHNIMYDRERFNEGMAWILFCWHSFFSRSFYFFRWTGTLRSILECMVMRNDFTFRFRFPISSSLLRSSTSSRVLSCCRRVQQAKSQSHDIYFSYFLTLKVNFGWLCFFVCLFIYLFIRSGSELACCCVTTWWTIRYWWTNSPLIFI